MSKLKDYIQLHLNILLFSLTSVFSKAASVQYNKHGLSSPLLYLFLFLMVANCGIYAITWQQVVMILVACALLYLAIVKKFEPMLLLTIAFGMLLVNLPLGGLMSPPPEGESWTKAGLLYLFSQRSEEHTSELHSPQNIG